MNEQITAAKDCTTKRILLYIGITFGITYLLEFLVIWPLVNNISPGMQAVAQLLVGSMMFIPAIGVLLTRLITKEGFKNSYIVPKTGKRSIPHFLFGWFGPALLIALGAVIYFVLCPDKFDANMTYLATVLEASGVKATPQLVRLSAISQLISASFLPLF